MESVLSSIIYNIIEKLVLLYPAHGAECESFFWFNKLLNIRVVSGVFPAFVLVVNLEKMNHTQGLSKVRDELKGVKALVVQIHCVEDWVSPYSCNVTVSRRFFNKTELEITSLQVAPQFIPKSKLHLPRDILLV